MEPVELEMNTTASLTLAFLFSATLTGFYLYETHAKFRLLEKKVNDIEYTAHETESLQETQADALHECAERIREKKDYDELEEVEDGKYQAWNGVVCDSKMELQILIWREKESTVKKNQDWTSWDKTPDGSCIVRDFYLGNGSPDFSWNVFSDANDIVSAKLFDTLINGWDSVCKIQIVLKVSKESLSSFVEKETFEGSQTCNLLLKKCVEKGLIQWSRILIDQSQN